MTFTSLSCRPLDPCAEVFDDLVVGAHRNVPYLVIWISIINQVLAYFERSLSLHFLGEIGLIFIEALKALQ
jgi:hypothetical protein